MTTVAVTGASGYLARVLLERLAHEGDVARVIGIDLVEPAFTTRNLEFYKMDVRSPDLADAIRGADVLVHLVFAFSGDTDEMRDVNVGGTKLALEAAKTAGVRKVIHASSTMVYGAHPDNPFFLTEDAPLRPIRELPHSGHNAESEDVARASRGGDPDMRVVVLRFCPVFGPTLSGTSARFVEAPYALALRGYEVPAQAVHEDDAARALMHAITADLDGAYNVCPDDHVPAGRVTEILGQRRVELDPGSAGRITERMWRWGVGGTPASFLPFLMYPWVASNEKIRATGFAFTHGTEAALEAGAEARRGWVAVGPARFRPRRLAVLAGTVGAVVLGSAARSARNRRNI